jgi:D-arabinose 1-dehydrogenase-like Zn-dependent alcohol dehydrogenase
VDLNLKRRVAVAAGGANGAETRHGQEWGRRQCARFGTTGRERQTTPWSAASCRRPRPGTVRCRVRLEASGVNPSDTYRRHGPPAMEYPRVVTNSDGAGVVDQVGPGVPVRWLGERVWLYNGQRNGR